jgi:hypothetical protein
MKKIGLQIGMGLIVGISALLMTAPQAQAGTPCPPANLADQRTCSESSVIFCDDDPEYTIGPSVCYDTDGDCYNE